jgi:glycosyltransferase involved in cell wall biosynthesis
MDILLINKFFYEKGGTERYFFSLSDALQEHGHRVTHFSMRHASNLPSPYERYFVREKRYDESAGIRANFSRGLSFVRSKEAAKSIAELLRDHPPHIAHLQNIYHQITPSIIPVLREAGIPVVMTLHDYKLICPNYTLLAAGKYCDRCVGGKYYHAPFVRCNGGVLLRSALLAFEAYWQKWTHVYDGIGCFLAPSHFMRERFIDAGFDPERVIYLPAFVPQGDAGVREGVKSGAWPALPQKYILYFGRLSREKGLFTLLAALKKCDGVSLVMAGDGPERHRLVEYVRTNNLNVSFTGYLQKPALDEVIARARAVVLPSEWPENAPFTVIEAAALGVPVIVSNMGGLPELAGYFDGIVYPSGDSAVLAQAIQELWSSDALAERTGRKAASEARVRFDKATHIRSLEKIYKRVMGGDKL